MTSEKEDEMLVDEGQSEPSGQKGEDNAESSSTGSDGGKGSGSGGGYSADYSSSDASSEEATKGAPPEMKLQRLKLGSSEGNGETRPSDARANKKVQGKRAGHRDTRPSNDSIEESKDGASHGEAHSLSSQQLPQWNGIRIQHPMDPRIDISTVGRIQASILPLYHPGINAGSVNKESSPPSDSSKKQNSIAPSIDQYVNLMEVVRPFFHSHGISEAKEGDEEAVAQEGGTVDGELQDQKSVRPVYGEDAGNTAEKKVETSGKNGSNEDENIEESDNSSMIVLARTKKKHAKNRNADDPALDESNYSANDGINSSSSEKKVRIQPPQDVDEGKEGSSSPSTEAHSNENEGGGSPATDSVQRQESTSATSSSEDRNQGLGHGMNFRLPAVVSEYGSSRTGSSGNSNMMSTSGSGSAGNSGSGTASGSNQGGSSGSGNGSSGSGNDNGGISFQGNGSSGSSNDVKGSSEDTADNSGENNSGGNSDGTNSNSAERGNVQNSSGPRPSSPVSQSQNPENLDQLRNDQASPHATLKLADNDGSEARREKKLQDKKRKRMNMRREYEEQVQKDMESSEGSRDRDEASLFRPGRPVTLDKVMSFTQVPLILVKHVAPFQVVHTNAAYSRLSGIDAHNVVGKPIASLLSLPDGANTHLTGLMAGESQQHTTHPNLSQSQAPKTSGLEVGNEAMGLSAAEAAGRAAAASQDISIDRLIANSGYGMWNKINVINKPLLGRDVTMTKSEARSSNGREESSNGSSITGSYEGSQNHFPCSMAVSPVVGSSEQFMLVREQEAEGHKAKRRKHHQSDSSNQSSSGTHQGRRAFHTRDIINRKRQVVTHYVIQLGLFEGSSPKSGSLGSQSSTSTNGEARILDLPGGASSRQVTGREESLSNTSKNNDGSNADEALDVADSAGPSPLEAIG